MNKPLHGLTVLNTRPAEQAEELTLLLEAAGAKVIERPMLAVESSCDLTELNDKLSWLGAGNWLLFTSANGVRSVASAIDFSQYKIAAIGRKTAAALQACGAGVDFVAHRSYSEGMAVEFLRHLSETGERHARVLQLRVENASTVLPQMLVAEGVVIEALSVYRVKPPDSEQWDSMFPAALVNASLNGETSIRSGEVCAFTSSQAVRNFTALVRQRLGHLSEPEIAARMKKVAAVAVGPKTAQTVREQGLTLVAVSEEASVESVVDALIGYWGITEPS